MVNKVIVTHEEEQKIALYCAENDIDLLNTSVYDTCMATFKDCPIMIEKKREDGETEEINMTFKVARQIECSIDAVYRIAKEAALKKKELEANKWQEKAKAAKDLENPNLDTLVDNLYRLNIVDRESYLSLICFLMQLRYTRLNKFESNDKTGIFFNGVARNGKTATAKAICAVESEYGKIMSVNSAKAIEDPHEENIWTTHLNFFDEVKPTDIDRSTLFRLINGGEWDVNPKGKPHYTVDMNANYLFASNESISLQQRRISVVKFGNRLTGRPLGPDTLKNCIKKIMESLPPMDVYNDIYQKIADINTHRLNPLGYESILTYLDGKIWFVKEPDSRTLSLKVQFSPHDIFSCIKKTYSKQITSSERKDAINDALKDMADKKFLNLMKYCSSSTLYYRITGEQYLRFRQWFDKINTTQEDNVRISKDELKEYLNPYFIEDEEKRHSLLELREAKSKTSPEITEIEKTNDFLVKQMFNCDSRLWDEHGFLDREIYDKGKRLFLETKGKIQMSLHDSLSDKLDKFITPEVCKYVASDLIVSLFPQVDDGSDFLIDDRIVLWHYEKMIGVESERERIILDDKKYNAYWMRVIDWEQQGPWNFSRFDDPYVIYP